MNSEGSSRKRATNQGAETCSDTSNGTPLEVSVIEHVSAMRKSPLSSENRVPRGLGTMSNIDEIEAPNEASTVAVAGAAGGARMAGVELVATPNDRLHRKSCESCCLENNRSKKAMLAARVGLKIDNEHFDFGKAEAHANCK